MSEQNTNFEVILGDCAEVLNTLGDETVQVIVTSPPYARRREKQYGGVDPELYVEWILPIAAEMKRVLRPQGSLVLNIKEHVDQGQRHPYVNHLIDALRAQGWLHTETYIWEKRDPFPGKWPNRFRDAWEPIFHFTKRRQFDMHQQAVMVPIGDWATRLASLSPKDQKRTESATGSGFGRRRANWAGRDFVYPSNVLRLATESGDKAHGAVFPVSLPHWFIRLFSLEGELVVDPFSGSGTTGVAAAMLGRRFVGIERDATFAENSRRRIASTKRTTDEPTQPSRSGRVASAFSPVGDAAAHETDADQGVGSVLDLFGVRA